MKWRDTWSICMPLLFGWLISRLTIVVSPSGASAWPSSRTFIWPSRDIATCGSLLDGAEHPPAALTKLEVAKSRPSSVSATAWISVYWSTRTRVRSRRGSAAGPNLNVPASGDGLPSTRIHTAATRPEDMPSRLWSEMLIGTVAASSARAGASSEMMAASSTTGRLPNTACFRSLHRAARAAASSSAWAGSPAASSIVKARHRRTMAPPPIPIPVP